MPDGCRVVGGGAMGQAKKDATLDNRTNRLKLPPRKEPYWVVISEGEHIGYYRPQNKAAGTWTMKWRDKATGKRIIKSLSPADDYSDADGTRILSFAHAQAHARDWFKARTRDAKRKASGEEVKEGPYTVADAMADYAQDCSRRGTKTLAAQISMVKAHILPELGKLEVANLTRRRLEKWLETLAATGRRLKVPKGSDAIRHAPPPSTDIEKRKRKDSANRVLIMLKAALNNAHSREGVSEDTPWREVKAYKGVGSARTRFLSIEDQIRLVNACPPDFQRVVRGALLTGARYGELTKVTVSGYNREAQSLYFPAHITKNGKARHVFLTEEGIRFFDAVTAGRPADETLFLQPKAHRRGRKAVGGIWTKGDQDYPMRNACTAAGISPLTFHELRHTAASTWIAAGMDLILVARQLGHSSTIMVEKHYGHLCPNAAAARFRALAPTLGILGPDVVAPLQIKAGA